MFFLDDNMKQGPRYLCRRSDAFGRGQEAQTTDPLPRRPIMHISPWLTWPLCASGWLSGEVRCDAVYDGIRDGLPFVDDAPYMRSRRCSARATMLRGWLGVGDGVAKRDVRGVENAADGDEAEDVFPVHDRESVLHGPRGRGPLICQEVEDVDEDGGGVEDKYVIVVVVVTCCQLANFFVDGPFRYGTVDEWPKCPRVLVGVLLCMAEEMGGEIERAGRAQDADETGVVGEFGVECGGDERTLHCLLWRVYNAVMSSTPPMASLPAEMDVQEFLALVRSVCSRIPPASLTVADFKC